MRILLSSWVRANSISHDAITVQGSRILRLIKKAPAISEGFVY